MVEYKQIFQKQADIIAQEIADHQRRVDVAQGALVSLNEKLRVLQVGGTQTQAVKNQIATITSEIDRHTKVVTVETQVISAITVKKNANQGDYTTQISKCRDAKRNATISVNNVNDAVTTLTHQREYQVQITNLKTVLISTHEEALSKREEARKLYYNYTTQISTYTTQAEGSSAKIT